MPNHDVLIIGGGPGGYVAAIKAAQHDLNVGLVEKEAVGGVCLNWGCIPTKAMLKSAKAYLTVQHAKDYGVTVGDVSLDFEAVMKRKNNAVKKLTGGVKHLLKKNGVTVYNGEGTVKDANTVQVGDDTITTKNLILATGARPAVPPIDGLKEGLEKGFVKTSKELLDIKELPKRLVVIGGGVIGMEFATMFNAFGVEVTVVEREKDMLLGVDGEIRNAFLKKLQKDGVTLKTNADVTKVSSDRVTYKHDGQESSVKADMVLLSVGMRPNVESFEALELEMDKAGVKTDEYMRTSVENVFAIGDLNGKYQLAHVASKEGLVAIDTILGHDHAMDYKAVPSGIYTFPEIAQVGLTEEEAKAQNIDYKSATFPLAANGKAIAEGETDGLVKMIAEKKYGEVIGVHILAPTATDMISEAVLGMNVETTVDEYARAIHPHPTLSETLHETALGILHKPIHI